MIRGFILSAALHVILFLFMWVNVADILFPQKPVKAIQVRLVLAKNVKKTDPKKKIEKVKTQQSAAPKEAPKPKKKKKPKPKPKKKVPTIVVEDKTTKVPKKKINKPKEKKVEPPQQVEKVEPKKEPRPPKLDKTKDKKNLVQDKEKKKITEEPKNFLDALSFIESLKAEKEAMFEGEETDPTTINLSDQADIAVVRRHIERNWYKTPGTAGVHTIHIRINLSRDGSLRSMEVIEGSGSRSFDKSLERAVRKSVPLPIPPEKYELFETIDLHFTDAS